MRRAVLLMAFTALALVLGNARAAEWEMRITDGVTVEVLHKQAPIVTATYNFWGPEWKWAGSGFRIVDFARNATTFSGDVRDLGLTLTGTITRPAPNALRFAYALDAANDLDGIIGGGLEFSLRLDSPSFDSAPAPPVLLDDNKGWRWEVSPGQAVAVSFDSPLPNVYFERGQKQTIRTFLVGTTLSRGRHSFAMTVSLPEGGAVLPSLAERYGRPDTSTWRPDALLWNKSPVDLSFLNDKPAGQHGFLQARGGQLVFADGTPARFWGGNIAAYAIFANKEEVAEQAGRIAQLGYNLMRIHHHDSMRWVSPTVIDKSRDDSQHLDPAGMGGLDWWIKCLRDQGVYVWLDLHVGRQFKPGDGIAVGFDEIEQAGGEVKGFCYFNQRVEDLMKAFNQAYLTHVNPYTGLAYKDDPAVMGLLISNENDLTHHFGNTMLPDKNNPVHNRIFDDAVKAFCAKTGLPYERTWRTWEPGPSKLFLNDREHRFDESVLAGLAELGVKVPVATTNTWGNMGLCGLPALADGGIIDAHSYGDDEALSANPRYAANFISWIAAAQVCGKPLSITEWNVPYPGRDRCTAPLYVMSIACLQGWDAPMIYNYSQRGFDKPDRADTWSTFYDPGLTALMPAAAIAFRRGDVKPANETYCLNLKREQLYDTDLNPTTSAAIRTLAERSKLTIGLPDVPELDWDRATQPPAGAKLVADPARDFIPPGEERVRSDTGELMRDWAKGIQTINTPRTQVAQGWLGGEAIDLADVALRIATPKAAVAVTSLDDSPIATSKRLLITTVARVVADNGRMPYLSEPVSGTLTIRSKAEGLKLRPLAPDGTQLPAIAIPYANGAYTITLPAGDGVHWYLLT
jgi:hypothetical protein